MYMEFLLQLAIFLLMVDVLLSLIALYIKLTERQPASFLEIYNLAYDQQRELKRILHEIKDEIKDENVRQLIENHLKTQDTISIMLEKMKRNEKDDNKK